MPSLSFSCAGARSARFVRSLAACAILFLSTAMLAVSSGMAQDARDGSLYSRFGIGALQLHAGGQGTGIGHAGFALHSLQYVNPNNPGAWADQVLTRISAGFAYQNLVISDKNKETSRLGSGHLSGIQLGFPLIERKLGIALGFAPFSRVSYNVANEGTLFSGDPARPDTVGYLVNFFGSGGIQQVTGGLGYRFSPGFSAGASLNALFGLIDNGRETIFLEGPNGPLFLDTNLETSTRLNGFSATFGALFSVQNVFAEEDFISVGGAFTFPATLSAKRVTSLGENLDRDTLGTTISGKIDMPWQLGLGVAYYPDTRWTLSAGGKFAPWTDLRSTIPLPGYDSGTAHGLSDVVQLGTGVEFLPAGTDLLASWPARIAYRFGISWDRAYISPDRNMNIETTTISAGFGLPTLIPGARFDINMQAGIRGAANADLVRDVFYRLSMSINIGERWFQTPKLR